PACLSHPRPPTSGDAPSRPNWPDSSIASLAEEGLGSHGRPSLPPRREREAIELALRHDLQGADLAAVLGVPRNQAQGLASHARGELEAALGPLFVARTGRRGCA